MLRHEHRPRHENRPQRRITIRRGVVAANTVALVAAVGGGLILAGNTGSQAGSADAGNSANRAVDLKDSSMAVAIGKSHRSPTRTWTKGPRPTTSTSTTTTSSSTTTSSTATKTSTATTTSTPTSTTATTTSAPTGWPNASNTGAKGTLTKKSGMITITTNNTVIENTDLTGGIIVKAGVTGTIVRNVKITTTGYWGIDLMGSSSLVEDTTIVGTKQTNSGIGDAGRSNTFRRLNLYGSEDGIKLGSGATLIDSYVHDLAFDPVADSHNDAVQFQSYTGISVVHNQLLTPHEGTSAILMGGGEPRGGASNILVDRNLMAGGAYTLYGPEGGSSHSSNVRVTNNRFSTSVFPNGGKFGPATQWETGSGNVWSGNAWYDGAKAGQPVNP